MKRMKKMKKIRIYDINNRTLYSLCKFINQNSIKPMRLYTLFYGE